ncbi:hypothetical protein JCM11641_002236 [Rhodosporidiobolus odoratus]
MVQPTPATPPSRPAGVDLAAPTSPDATAIEHWEAGEDQALNINYAKVKYTLNNQVIGYSASSAWEYLWDVLLQPI